MFDFLFGWRKASTCKKLIRHVQCRLNILMNKRESIIRQARDDIVQLIKKGLDHAAFSRVEQLIIDQNLKDVYDRIDYFGEFIIIQLPYIRRHKDCPNDINEAMSSLLFASARLGDLPELQKLRKLFGKRYGNIFVMTAVKLLPGNLVNRQIIENLGMKRISDDVKFRVMKEIARQNNLQLRPPDIDHNFELQYHQEGNFSLRKYELEGEESACNSIGGAHFQAWNDIVDSSVGNTTASQPSLDIVEPLGCHLIHEGLFNPEKKEKLDLAYEAVELSPDRSSGQSIHRSFSPRRHKVSEALSESPPQTIEKTIVYLDDVEEFQPKEDDKDEDQRSFMFKLTTPPANSSQSSPYSCHGSYTEDHTKPCETWDGKSSCRTATKTKRSHGKKLVMKCGSEEYQVYNFSVSSMKDVEYALYYGEGGNYLPMSRSCHQRRHQNNMSDKRGRNSSFRCGRSRKMLMSPYPREKICCGELGQVSLSHKCKYDRRKMYNNRDLDHHSMACDCSLEHPCYFSISYDDGDSVSPSPRRNSRTTRFWEISRRNFQQGECKETFHHPVVTNLKSRRVTNNAKDGRREKLNIAMPLKNHIQREQNKKADEVDLSDCEVVSSRGSCTRPISPWTLPHEHHKAIIPYVHNLGHDSQGSPPCRHVHPKLPDYDDLVSKFMALKIEHLQSTSGEVKNSLGRS